MKNFENQLQTILGGINAAENYLCEDLDAICSNTMAKYAQKTLKSVRSAGKKMQTIIDKQKQIPLFLSAMTDIAVSLGWQRIEFEDSRAREQLIRSWAEKFVATHRNTDWEKVDYIKSIDGFIAKNIEKYLLEHPRKQYTVKYVLGTEAVREYSNCVDNCEKWSDSSLCDCGSVSIGKFNTPEELAAYKQGIDDANGYLEAEEMMTDEEWEEYLNEYGNNDDDE